MRVVLLITAALFVGLASSAEEWKIVDVDRVVDATSQVVKVSCNLKLENAGSAELNSVSLLIPSREAEHISYIAATDDASGKSLSKFKVSKGNVINGFQSYSIELLKRVKTGGVQDLKVSYRLTEVLEPFPAKIAQGDNQFVLYYGSAYYAAAYPVKKEKTTVNLGGKILSATTVNPSKQETEKVVYGPYNDQPAFNDKEVKIHYENNSPFVVATVVERTIEVSHWGNIAVEEYIELVHKGAQLKGSFSRLDFQLDRRGRRQPALLSFTSILPAGARDIYYRDEIGNITTSAVRVKSQSVDVEIRPRYPLFGGWRTSYVIGYNVPSYEYLYRKGDSFALKMRVLDHIIDNVVVEKLTTKIILPEHVKKIKVTTPYTMDRRPDETRATYLDTIGRTIVVLQKDFLVSEHIQHFTLSYDFEYSNMIREPLLASAFFFCLFTVFIIYMRFDFTIVADAKQEIRAKVDCVVNKISPSVERKNYLFNIIQDAANEYKNSRDASILQESKKKLDNERNKLNETIRSTIAELKSFAPESFEKASELDKYDKPAVDAIDAYLSAVQKSTSKAAGPEDKTFTSKVSEARIRADSILASI